MGSIQVFFLSKINLDQYYHYDSKMSIYTNISSSTDLGDLDIYLRYVFYESVQKVKRKQIHK